LPPAIRLAVLRHLKYFQEVHRLPLQNFIMAAEMLDLHQRIHPWNSSAESLPLRCAVAARVVGKLDQDFRILDILQQNMYETFSAWLQENYGLETHDPVPMAQAYSRAEERFVCRVSWRISQPSTLTWLHVFCERLQAMNPSLFPIFMNIIWYVCENVRMRLLCYQQVYADSPPCHIACGILCIAVCEVGLLSLDLLRPPSMSTLEWSTLFCSSLRHDEVPRCPFPELKCWMFLSSLEEGTGQSSQDLRRHTHKTVRALCSHE